MEIVGHSDATTLTQRSYFSPKHKYHPQLKQCTINIYNFHFKHFQDNYF